MKKISLFLFVVTVIFFGCKKVSESLVETSIDNLETQIRSYFANAMLKASPWGVKKIEETLSKIDFSKIERKPFTGNAEILIAPINGINTHDFVTIGKSNNGIVKVNSVKSNATTNSSTVTKVVFFITSGGIKSGNIIEISSQNYDTSEIESSFTDILALTKKDFNGHVSINSVSQKLSNDWGYKNGQVISSTIVKAGGGLSSADNSLRTNSCQAWYLHTDYYIMIGNEAVVYDSSDTFIGTTGCGGSENQGFEPPGESGSGGYETPQDTTCAQSRRLANDAAYNAKIAEMQDSLNLDHEIGYSMTQGPGGYLYTYFMGSSNQIPIAAGITSPINGFLHTHSAGNGNGFSLQDIKAFYELYANGLMSNPGSFSFTLVLPGGKIQLLRITDISTFASFGNSYLTDLGFVLTQGVWGSSFSANNSYTDQTVNLLNFLNSAGGSGLSLFESDTNISNYGYQKVEVNAQTGSLKRTKCTN